jgi:acyl-CoA synthetase (AMP-forming)/AMP-acid ligase II
MVKPTVLPQLLEEAAERYGERPFLRGDGWTMSYAECALRAGSLAGWLAACGVSRGERVAAVLPNGPEMVLTWFALGRLGAVLVPLNPALVPSEVAPLLTQVGASAMISGAAHHAGYDGLCAWKLKVLVGEGEVSGAVPFTAPEDFPTPPCQARPEDLAAILQTSGTTGEAKGAGLTHYGYTWPAHEFVQWMEAVPEDRFLGCLPLFHMAGQAFLASSVAAGASMTLIPKFSAHQFWNQVRAHSITLCRHLGEMLAVLCSLPETPLDRQHTLRAVYGGGARREVAEAFEERFGVAVVEGYGLTETNTVLRNEIRSRRLGSIGRPLPYGEVRIADSEGRALPPSVPGEEPTVGEIQVRRNPVMMTGYIGSPDLAASCFAGDWFKTGDLAYLDADGYFYFFGREKDIIRRRGENINPGRIQQALESHPAVAAAAVVGVPDELGGEEVKAYLVFHPGYGHDPEGLVEWCRRQLADFEIPRFFEICTDLPTTSTEKINKGRLRRMGTHGGPCYDRRAQTWKMPTVAGPVLSAAEPRALQEEQRPVHELVAEQVERAPEAPAVRSDEESLTYRELDRRARELASTLRRLGVAPEERVVLCLDPAPSLVVSALAVLQAGGAYVPLDPYQAEERLELLTSDAGARLVLAKGDVAARLSARGLPVLRVDERREGSPARGSAERLPSVALSQPAYISYAASSTNGPRRVEVSHAMLANIVAWHLRAAGARRAVQWKGTASDAFFEDLWPCLASGGAIDLPTGEPSPSLMTEVGER